MTATDPTTATTRTGSPTATPGLRPDYRFEGVESLAPMRVAERLPRLRAAIAEAECQALLVTKMVNLRYLTGFTGSDGMALVLPDELVFVTDGRYRDQSAEQLAAAGVEARIEIAGVEQREVLRAVVEASRPMR